MCMTHVAEERDRAAQAGAARDVVLVIGEQLSHAEAAKILGRRREHGRVADARGAADSSAGEGLTRNFQTSKDVPAPARRG